MMRELILTMLLAGISISLFAQKKEISFQNFPVSIDSLKKILNEQYLYVSDNSIIYYGEDGDFEEVKINEQLEVLDRTEIATVWVRRSLKISGPELALTFENYIGNKVRYVFKRVGSYSMEMVHMQIIKKYPSPLEMGD